MSDSIENDEKFVELMQRLVYEREQVRASRQVIWDLNGCDLLDKNITVKLEDINRDVEIKSETTLKHIYKYIDRYAERKVQDINKPKTLKDRGIMDDAWHARQMEILRFILDR